MTAAKKPKHGGPRKGAGRPVGSKGKEAKGKTAVTRSISMHPTSWQKLDKDRKEVPRGRYIEDRLGL